MSHQPTGAPSIRPEVVGQLDKNTVEFIPQMSDNVYVIANVGAETFTEARTFGERFYKIPAGTPEKPGIKVIRDGLDRLDMGDGRFYPVVITARDIAMDLVREEHARHGIFICKGDAPTEEECAAALAKRREWQQEMVREGDILWERFHRHEHISDNHRCAAHELRVKREWATKTQEFDDCPGCGETVLASAAFCRHCRTVINEEQYRKLNFAPENQRPLRVHGMGIDSEGRITEE